MTDYSGLAALLAQRGITRSALGAALGISSKTIAKIAKGEPLSPRVLARIAGYLGCAPADLCREISPNALLQQLRDEQAAGLSGGIYHELQVRMTYNSNHIEGSRLTEDQTRLIFETNTVNAGDGIPVDDILETVHHFRAIDLCIAAAEQPLTEDFIKQLHGILKADTKDARLAWFAVGEYKRRPNTVGGRQTTPPRQVQPRMAALLAEYNALPAPTIGDIIAFHARFEQIHPFQDGNGRVGRLVAFKECLRCGLTPFLIEDEKKLFYYRGLAQWDTEPGYLTDTCLDGQDTVAALMRYFGIPQG